MKVPVAFSLCAIAQWIASVQAVPTATEGAFGTLYGRANNLVDCLNNKDVPIQLLSDPEFAELARPYNLRLAYTPAAIAVPTTNQHVQDAVRCANEHNYKVQAKSGGHSYASYSSGGQNGSLVVDLQSYQNISVDATTFVATVGGGVRLGNLALAIYNQSQRALPHGTCPGVGIGGHASHGGYGYDSRLWGLTLDTVVGLDVVLANGSFVHASGGENTDLYFALRGAADSFGIITTFYFQTLPAPDAVINFAFAIPDFLQTKELAAQYFLHLQAFALNASVVDRKLTFGMYMDASSYSISGNYFGSLDDFNNKIKPELLRTLPTPKTKSVQSLGWIPNLVVFSNQASLSEPLTGYNAHDTFYAKSIETQENAPLTQAAMEAFFGYLLTTGKSAPFGWFSIINLYGGADSQINAKPESFAAYSHRSGLWVFQNYGFDTAYTPDITTFVDNMNSILESAQPNGDFVGYLNYVDPELTAAEAHAEYYGADLYARLLAIKNVVDPLHTFWNPQSVGN